MKHRDLKADLRWGVRQALILTGIVFIPAVAVAGGEESRMSLLVRVFALYLLFAAGAGIVIGLYRPALRKGGGAALIGSAVGAVGFLALIYFPQGGRPTPPLGAGVASAIAGALVGAGLGWWMWFRYNQR